MRALCAAAFVVLASTTLADDGPRTGYFEARVTPAGLLGQQAAQSIADVLSPDDELSYQFYVPRSYDAASPAGLIVWISSSTRGGSPRKWNGALTEQNLIAIGANKTGNRTPVAERMLKAMLAPQFAAKSYRIDPARVYVAGYSSGASTATRVAVAQPAIFKGGLYVAGGVSWGDNEPPKIDLIRRNRHVFLIGSNDYLLEDTKRVFLSYRDAGVENSLLILVPNLRHEWPGPSYFSEAIDFLDVREAASPAKAQTP